jgi:hypothetical protein
VPAPTLHLALDLGNTGWELAFATGIAHAPRLRAVPARDLAPLDREVVAAKLRFGLPADAPAGEWPPRARARRALTARATPR